MKALKLIMEELKILYFKIIFRFLLFFQLNIIKKEFENECKIDIDFKTYNRILLLMKEKRSFGNNFISVKNYEETQIIKYLFFNEKPVKAITEINNKIKKDIKTIVHKGFSFLLRQEIFNKINSINNRKDEECLQKSIIRNRYYFWLYNKKNKIIHFTLDNCINENGKVLFQIELEDVSCNKEIEFYDNAVNILSDLKIESGEKLGTRKEEFAIL